MSTLTIVEHSERFDRPNDRVRRDAKAFREVGDVVVRTEMAPDAREGMLNGKGWSWCQSHKDAGHDETVTEWDNASVSLAGMPLTRELSPLTYFRAESGAETPTIKALMVPLAVATRTRRSRLVVISAHMPTDSTERRQEVWIDCCAGLVRLVTDVRSWDPTAKVVIVNDWNKNFRQAAERAMIEDHVCKPLGMKQAWDGFVPKSGGTHGPSQIIDGAVVDESITVEKCWLLPDTDGSDHRPWAVTLRNL